MKRLFITLVTVVMASAFTYAQHFNFLGIELDGTLENFDKKIKEKGFKNLVVPILYSVYTSPDTYTGTYADHEVYLTVYTTPKTKKVFSVSVKFSFNTEDEAMSMFIKMKKTIENEYKDYSINGEKQTLKAYGIGPGTIVVQYQEAIKYHVTVDYLDNANTILYKEESKEK